MRKMSCPKLFVAAVLLALACASAAPSPAAPLERERAGQSDGNSTAPPNGLLEDIIYGVAAAVTDGALQPLADVALKPLVSAVGSSLLDQLFSAAGAIITEWNGVDEGPEIQTIKDNSLHSGF